MAVKIGPCRIADEHGTHEPDEVVSNPSDALLALAESKTRDPETGRCYAEPASEAPAPIPAEPAAPAAPSETTEADQ